MGIREEMFSAFEHERPRHERSSDLAHILIEHGLDPEAEAIEPIAAVTRWADAHVSAGFDALMPLVARIQADAWDKGHRAGDSDAYFEYAHGRTLNPYRADRQENPT